MKEILEHRYSLDERRQQLQELVRLLPGLVAVARSTPEVAHLAAQYESSLEVASTLLKRGFSQEQLSELSRAIPDAFFRHKEWSPPLIQVGDAWQEPLWFTRLEASLQPVLRTAKILRELGYY